jgi:hypothetical protein
VISAVDDGDDDDDDDDFSREREQFAGGGREPLPFAKIATVLYCYIITMRSLAPPTSLGGPHDGDACAQPIYSSFIRSLALSRELRAYGDGQQAWQQRSGLEARRPDCRLLSGGWLALVLARHNTLLCHPPPPPPRLH